MVRRDCFLFVEAIEGSSSHIGELSWRRLNSETIGLSLTDELSDGVSALGKISICFLVWSVVDIGFFAWRVKSVEV